MSPPPAVIVFALCASEILSMTAFAMFPALQPLLRSEWRLSNTAAGWTSGTFYFGYMVAVPFLTGLTDCLDPRRVWLASAALTLVSVAAFGVWADGLWSAVACQFFAGVGLAGTYMPGLKLLADLTDGVSQARFVALYTTSFTVGSSLSFYLLGVGAEALGWRLAVLLTATGPLCAITLMALTVPPQPMGFPSRAGLRPPAFGPVLRSPATRRFVFTYMTHMWELFAFRAWLVPFLTFCQALQPTPVSVSPTTAAAGIALLGVPASIVGNELSARFGRRRVITLVMTSALGVSLFTGLASSLPWMVIVGCCAAYSVLITADSSALTSGLIAAAAPEVRGVSMALYSMTGFAGAFSGALVVGGVLDVLGGQSQTNWVAAFMTMGLPGIAGLVLIRRGNSAS